MDTEDQAGDTKEVEEGKVARTSPSGEVNVGVAEAEEAEMAKVVRESTLKATSTRAEAKFAQKPLHQPPPSE